MDALKGSDVSRRIAGLLMLSCFSLTQALGPAAFAQADPGPAGSAPASAEPPAPAQAEAAPAPPPPVPRKLDKAALDEARQSYKRGELAYQAGDHAGAAVHFKAAQDIVPSPHAAFWLGMSLRGSGKVPEAIAEFRTLLASAAAGKLGDEKLAEARAALEELQKVPAKLSLVTEPPGASVTIDGQPGPDVTPLVLELSPGTHVLLVALKGHHTIEIELGTPPGTTGEQTLKLEPLPPPPPVVVPVELHHDEEPEPVFTPPPPAAPNLAPAYVLFGLAGASAITGTVFGVMSLGKKSDYDQAPTSDRADAVDRDTLATDIAFGAALTFGLAGLAVILAPLADPAGERPKQPTQARARLTVTPHGSQHGAGASARVAF